MVRQCQGQPSVVASQASSYSTHGQDDPVLRSCLSRTRPHVCLALNAKGVLEHSSGPLSYQSGWKFGWF